MAVLNCEDQDRIDYLTDSFNKLSFKYKDKVLTRAEKILSVSCKEVDRVKRNTDDFKKSFDKLKKPLLKKSQYNDKYEKLKNYNRLLDIKTNTNTDDLKRKNIKKQLQNLKNIYLFF